MWHSPFMFEFLVTYSFIDFIIFIVLTFLSDNSLRFR